MPEEPRATITVEGIRTLEQRGVSSGISQLVMMENAGCAIASYLVSLARQKLSSGEQNRQLKILAVAGTGNNGGDVFVAVRHLAYYGDAFDVKLALMGRKENLKTGEAKTNWAILERLPQVGKLEITEGQQSHDLFSSLISSSDYIISGIFGTGFIGTPREPQRSIIQEINRRDRTRSFCISVDIPSGMEADAGNFIYAVESDATISMHAPKVGMLASGRSISCCGEIVVANIGLPF